jgi:hypothetical protein
MNIEKNLKNGHCKKFSGWHGDADVKINLKNVILA